jgi:hypothetical protein
MLLARVAHCGAAIAGVAANPITIAVNTIMAALIPIRQPGNVMVPSLLHHDCSCLVTSNRPDRAATALAKVERKETGLCKFSRVCAEA